MKPSAFPLFVLHQRRPVIWHDHSAIHELLEPAFRASRTVFCFNGSAVCSLERWTTRFSLSVWFNPFLINNWVKVLDEVCLEVFTKKWFFSYTVYVKSHSLTDPVRGVLLVLFYYWLFKRTSLRCPGSTNNEIMPLWVPLFKCVTIPYKGTSLSTLKPHGSCWDPAFVAPLFPFQKNSLVGSRMNREFHCGVHCSIV